MKSFSCFLLASLTGWRLHGCTSIFFIRYPFSLHFPRVQKFLDSHSTFQLIDLTFFLQGFFRVRKFNSDIFFTRFLVECWEHCRHGEKNEWKLLKKSMTKLRGFKRSTRWKIRRLQDFLLILLSHVLNSLFKVAQNNIKKCFVCDSIKERYQMIASITNFSMRNFARFTQNFPPFSSSYLSYSFQ